MRYLILIFLIGSSWSSFGQKYRTEQGMVSFFSETPIESIKAQNKSITSLFNAATGDIVFSVPVNEFQFEKSLMQEHFNEKYLETDKYPKATFQGKVQTFDATAKGAQSVKAVGKLTIHGVTQDVTIPGTLEATDSKTLVLKSSFQVKLVDYKIDIPKLLWQKIAEQVDVKLEMTYQLL